MQLSELVLSAITIFDLFEELTIVKPLNISKIYIFLQE